MACRAAFWSSGWRRKFHSCGTRSPARTRRWDLMRLRMLICTLQNVNHEEHEETRKKPGAPRPCTQGRGAGVRGSTTISPHPCPSPPSTGARGSPRRPKRFVVVAEPGAFGLGRSVRRRRTARPAIAAAVDAHDQVTQGGQGVVMLIYRDFGVALARVVAVAVKLRLGEEIRAAAFKDLQGAVFDSRRHRADAGTQLVDAFGDLQTATA